MKNDYICWKINKMWFFYKTEYLLNIREIK